MFEQRRPAHARVLWICDVIVKGKVRELPLSLITSLKTSRLFPQARAYNTKPLNNSVQLIIAIGRL